MTLFTRKDNELYCEQVSMRELAQKYGTPLYVYSATAISDKYREYDDAFAGVDHQICYAMKANSSHALLCTLAKLGSGADIVSGGELFRALKAGIKAERIVYSGVGKTRRELHDALEADILMFNVESFSEMALLNEVAGELGLRARISLRVNPNVDPQTHPYIATGLKSSKFGIRYESVLDGYARARAMEHIDVVGVDCHIGSQLTSVAPFVEAATKVRELVEKLRADGFDIRYLDLGGGLGITYDDEMPPSVETYGSAVKAVLGDLGVKIILEPGRSMVGNAGAMISSVLYTKQGSGKRFVMIDAGMNDLARPSLYGSFHEVVSLTDECREQETVDLVGPICESGDFIAKDRTMPALKAGDLIAVMSAGAYGFAMASTYNSRPLVAEVMVKGEEDALIRQRGTVEDLMRGEQPAPWHQ